MKLIKKIAAIMFAFMMVVSMSCNVKAEEGASPETTGTITIDNAVDGQTYTIYKLLDLESYVPETTGQTGLYSYKPVKAWETFLKSGEGKKYITIDENGYATWKNGVDEKKAAEFAQKALAYAKDPTNNISAITNEATITDNNNGTLTLKYSGLSLGYYLVGSSAGALCGLNTTNPNATIKEKNGVPSVEKTITAGGTFANDGKSNSVNIGDTISFQIRIDVRKGANNYVLHDELSTGLTLKENPITKNSIHLQADETIKGGLTDQDYTLTINSTGFDVTFKPEFLKTNEDKDYSIMVTYNAILNEKAVIGRIGNTNETYLNYGENHKTTSSKTTTYTFGIPVFKYTGTDTPLSGAKFQLYTDEPCKNEVNVKLDGTDYLVGSTDTNKNVMTSPASTGEFTIKGLKAGTYYLKEIEAPTGYNLLAKAIKVVIADNGQVQVEKNGAVTNVKRVEVQNKSGTLLPSTGGAGTTMIYLVGALLVLGSGVVLASKRRSNSK